jgi:hypothetical protein
MESLNKRLGGRRMIAARFILPGSTIMSGSIVSPIAAYATDSANEAKLASAASLANAQQNNLIDYFKAHAASITTPAQLMGNYRALSVVLGAFGIGSLISSPALVKDLMTQDPTSSKSVAYRLGNAKYLAFAHAMQSWSPAPFGSSSGVDAIVTAYQKNNFESAAGQQTAGMQQALYFTRMAPSITSLTQLQSDSSLMAVAVTGLGLPLSAFDNLTFAQQTSLMTQKLTITDLQKPSYVKHLAELYLVQQQLSSGSTTPTVALGSVASLFTTSSGSANGLLTIMQNAQEASSGTTTSLLGTTSSNTSSLLSLFA